jgi:hypothetical protein
MTIAELIAIASVRSGKKQKELAEEMGHKDATRLSKLSTGRLAADASEIIYLAQNAKLPPVETLAEFETERRPELAGVWASLMSDAAKKGEAWRKR